MHWPQIVITVLISARIVSNAVLHGQLKTGFSARYSIWDGLVFALIWTTILDFGGFWK